MVNKCLKMEQFQKSDIKYDFVKKTIFLPRLGI